MNRKLLLFDGRVLKIIGRRSQHKWGLAPAI
jgi:hypothetical protein